MNIKWDINQFFENRKTLLFFKILISVIVLTTISYVFYLSVNGKHNKFSVIETNIPEVAVDFLKIRKDTILVINTKNELNINQNIGDIVIGTKETINTNR